MTKKEKDAALKAIMELADSNDVSFTAIMALSLDLIVARCIRECGCEPPEDWNTEGVMQLMESALDRAYRNTLTEIHKN